MPTPNEQYKQYGQQPFYYINGLKISNDVTLPQSVIDVSLGSTLDSTATYQIGSSVALSASLLSNGLNGLDTGAVAASSVYAVYLVADPVSDNATGLIFSLSLTGPLMPFGYSAYALLGYVATDASKHILLGYWSGGDSARRYFQFDAFQATAVTAGASETYANVNLIHLVPNQPYTLVSIYSSFAAGAAGDTLSLQGGLATGAQAIITSQVVTVPVTTISAIPAQQVVISTVLSPVVNYKVSGTDTAAIDVAGYYFDL